MSAFIVDDITINKPVSWLEAELDYNHNYLSSRIKKIFMEAGYILTDLGRGNSDQMKKIAEDMFKLNCKAVNARYGEGQAEEFRSLDYKYQYCIAPDLYQVIKSLDCWLYQCTEGNCPDDPLFKAIRNISNLLCRLSVERSTQYEKAQWG